MSSNNSNATFQPESDVQIAYEDQQRINKFARLNAKMEDFKDDLKNHENNLKNIEDASEELMLVDEEESGLIPFLIGEIFISKSVEDTQKALEEEKEKLQKEIADVQAKSEKIKSEMSDLKVLLYAKFGNNINLEADDG
uniref:Prefoldin subunit 4 n=1 Tax=Clastoptera arizonana TaxID=38151 RepID=A0A1B6DQ76_9HEMI